MVASMLEAVERALRQRGRAHARRDPLRPRKPDQRFVRGDHLTPEQTREIELQNAAARPPAANPQMGADGVRRP
jgi:hypothetical protein